jgi:hypothetical protein
VQWPKLHLRLDVRPEIPILKGLYCTGHTTHFMDTAPMGFLKEKSSSLVLPKVMSNDQKSSMSAD